MTEVSIRDPRTGSKDYSLEFCTEPSLRKKASQARLNQKEWASADINWRADVLNQWKIILSEKYTAPLIDALSIDTGRYTESKIEVEALISTIERYIKNLPHFVSQDLSTPFPNIAAKKILEPIALVANISPWNFPLLLSFMDTIPALLAGSAVLIKPSEVTPRWMDVIEQSIYEVELLNGVCKLVRGDGTVGEQLIEIVDCVCFTGSTQTGKKIAAQCANLLIPCHLEMGGKDPAIVMKTANLDNAVKAILWNSMSNAGQVCFSTERVYVDSSIAKSFVKKLQTRMQNLRLNIENIKQGQIGPVIYEKQIEILDKHLDDALKKGAKLLSGGNFHVHHGGTWMEPTLLTNVDHSMLVMKEETFGPIIPVMEFADEMEAIRLANDSRFGLSASLFSEDSLQINRLSKEINAGAISVNNAGLTAFIHHVEKHSRKESGFGLSRMGAESLSRFLQPKAIFFQAGGEESPWWY